jgi:2-keto-4-pentenoate hydratase
VHPERQTDRKEHGGPEMSSSAGTAIASLADALWQAQLDRVPINPITDLRPNLTASDAYAVQTYNVDRRIGAGGVIRGRKVGLTSRATQQLFGVTEPSSGVLMADMFLDEGDDVALEALLQPRVTAEFAFLMESDLSGPGVTTVNAMAAIGGVLPAIEIVDSRIADWRIQLADTVADNASTAKVVLGTRIFPVAPLDLCHLGVLFYRNGSPIESAAGAAVLGNPARCVAWLANKLGSLGGGLRSGDIVLPGALHRLVPVRQGDAFRAHFAHLGTVTIQFTRRPT